MSHLVKFPNIATTDLTESLKAYERLLFELTVITNTLYKELAARTPDACNEPKVLSEEDRKRLLKTFNHISMIQRVSQDMAIEVIQGASWTKPGGNNESK